MTIDEFLSALAQTPRTWQLAGRFIRCPGDPNFDDELCPITAVEGQSRNAIFCETAAENIGLDTAAMQAIARAADANNQRGFSPELRSQLLAACGL